MKTKTLIAAMLLTLCGFAYGMSSQDLIEREMLIDEVKNEMQMEMKHDVRKELENMRHEHELWGY